MRGSALPIGADPLTTATRQQAAKSCCLSQGERREDPFQLPPKSASAAAMRSLTDIFEEYDFLDGDDRYRLLIDLGRTLDPMPDALKTDATMVRGCSASVWVYPVPRDDGQLHFLADSNAAITKGIVALVLSAVQDKAATEVAAMDVAAALAPFDLTRQLSSNRTQGVPNMIALVQATARRIAAG